MKEERAILFQRKTYEIIENETEGFSRTLKLFILNRSSLGETPKRFLLTSKGLNTIVLNEEGARKLAQLLLKLLENEKSQDAPTKSTLGFNEKEGENEGPT